jgi:hypothetical protein
VAGVDLNVESGSSLHVELWCDDVSGGSIASVSFGGILASLDDEFVFSIPDELVALGSGVIEIMPVTDFSGSLLCSLQAVSTVSLSRFTPEIRLLLNETAVTQLDLSLFVAATADPAELDLAEEVVHSVEGDSAVVSIAWMSLVDNSESGQLRLLTSNPAVTQVWFEGVEMERGNVSTAGELLFVYPEEWLASDVPSGGNLSVLCERFYNGEFDVTVIVRSIEEEAELGLGSLSVADSMAVAHLILSPVAGTPVLETSSNIAIATRDVPGVVSFISASTDDPSSTVSLELHVSGFGDRLGEVLFNGTSVDPRQGGNDLAVGELSYDLGASADGVHGRLELFSSSADFAVGQVTVSCILSFFIHHYSLLFIFIRYFALTHTNLPSLYPTSVLSLLPSISGFLDYLYFFI